MKLHCPERLKVVENFNVEIASGSHSRRLIGAVSMFKRKRKLKKEYDERLRSLMMETKDRMGTSKDY